MKNTKRDFIEIQIPDSIQSLSTLKLPDPSLLDYYKRLSNREIWVNINIDDDLVEYIYQIIQWNKEDRDLKIEDRKPIVVYVNSDGGSVDAVWAMCDAIETSKTPVYTVGLGKCYSSGAVLLMSGKKRFVFEHTKVLIHNGNTGMGSDVGRFINYADFTREIESRMKVYILKNTNISDELYEKKYHQDWWMFADEALELGIVTHMISNFDDIK